MDHRGRGDIIGVTSLLTGEPQTAHVEAETDVELWVLEGSILNNISTGQPELLDFLTGTPFYMSPEQVKVFPLISVPTFTAWGSWFTKC